MKTSGKAERINPLWMTQLFCIATLLFYKGNTSNRREFPSECSPFFHPKKSPLT